MKSGVSNSNLSRNTQQEELKLAIVQLCYHMKLQIYSLLRTKGTEVLLI